MDLVFYMIIGFIIYKGFIGNLKLFIIFYFKKKVYIFFWVKFFYNEVLIDRNKIEN